MLDFSLTTPPDGGRGCGERQEEMPYCCCGTSPWGSPIESFVIDPAIPWPGEFQRGMKILPRDPRDPESINDLVVFVGEAFYASPWDYVEECRLFGASRKASPDLPFEKLTPRESRMVFVHSKTIPHFDYTLIHREPQPLEGCHKLESWVSEPSLWADLPSVPGFHPGPQNCTFALKDLAILVHPEAKVEGDAFTIEMPSFSYRGLMPSAAAGEFGIGIFLVLPMTHIEFVRKPHEGAKERAEKAGFVTTVMEA